MRKRELYEYDGNGNKVEVSKDVCPACLKRADESSWDEHLDICLNCRDDMRDPLPDWREQCDE